jgi:hypothetical protein
MLPSPITATAALGTIAGLSLIGGPLAGNAGGPAMPEIAVLVRGG